MIMDTILTIFAIISVVTFYLGWNYSAAGLATDDNRSHIVGYNATVLYLVSALFAFSALMIELLA